MSRDRTASALERRSDRRDVHAVAAGRNRPGTSTLHAVAALIVALAVGGSGSASARQAVDARVVYAGRAVPGAVVTLTHGDHRIVMTSDEDGTVSLNGLDAGRWTVVVEMPGFVTSTREIDVPGDGGAPADWELTLKSFDDVVRELQATRASPSVSAPDGSPRAPSTPASPPSRAQDAPPPVTNRVDTDDSIVSTADVFVVNGSVNNAAASVFAQPRGFGNNRPQAGALYTGILSLRGGTSRWDARPYSFHGGSSAVPAHVNVETSAAVGGPIKPWRSSSPAPRFFVGYQGSSRQTANTESLLVPTARERTGDFSQTLNAGGTTVTIRDPLTGAPFESGAIPAARVSPQARTLLTLYPLPDGEAGTGSNYQATVSSIARQDDVQARVNHTVRGNMLQSTLALQRGSTRTRTAFGFEDVSRRSGVDVAASWTRRVRPRLVLRVRYQYTRVSSRVTPYFAQRVDISREAGIAGTAPDPENWGPPRLVFPGLASLDTATASQSLARTHAAGVEMYVIRGRHTTTIGGDVRLGRQALVSQQNARGALTFTGAATGVPFADFLLGLPATSAIGFGHPDKDFRSWSSDAYVSNDARLTPTVTLTTGLRWEYDAPVTEGHGRLANLDVAPGFTAVMPVTPRDPRGTLTGRDYPAALVTPDYTGLQPRAAVAWRPIAGSSLTIRAGYGLYRNAGLYDAIARALSGQPPFSSSRVVERSDAHPITIADAFVTTTPDTHGTMAVDPKVRAGYVQSWQLSAQRDVPGSLQVVASYLGSRGHRLLQQVLPNTYPPGGSSPCLACPTGFAYLTSNGHSSRRALQLVLRRRLRGGFAATTEYTLARALDDAATFSGGLPEAGAVAQDWRDPRAEWAPSSFDQRHTVVAQIEYTTGAGRRGGWLTEGLPGRVLGGWRIAADMRAGGGRPLTPIYLAALPGSGFVGLRPALTGVPVDDRPARAYANAAAFAPPPPGAWGDTGRHSIRGPAQFQLDLRLARTFAWGERRSVEWRTDVANILNRVTFARIDTSIGSPRFGLPTVANPMRTIETSLRVGF